MLPFHDGYAPFPASFSVAVSVERRVTTIGHASGAERRFASQARSRRRYVLEGRAASLDEARALMAFFEARRGKLQAFRFRDATDHQSCLPSAALAATDQRIGIGDGVERTFQLVKTDGGEGAYVREIVKPVASSVRLAIDGASTPTGFALDASGRVTFASAPAVGAIVSAGFIFDVPVRLDADSVETTLPRLGALISLRIPLMEVRDA